jgi:methionyl-tRNA synthetase
MKGHNCYYICGSDTHGTPIMLKAQSDGVKPERLVSDMAKSHRSDFIDFGIEFDNYHSTHHALNQELVEEVYLKLKQNDLIQEKEVEQAFDPDAKMFLPDRFVKGSCPKCKAHDQYGDNCESCGATYNPTELINPRSVVSGAVPVRKSSTHFFFKLSEQEESLKNWVYNNKNLQPEVVNKLKEWFETGLQNWDISRDEPYFGYKIPGTENKYFYVWLDAPIGYLASFKQMCNGFGIDFNSFWEPNSNHELYHFIGKDIIYFHTLFWPAVLKSSGYRLPTSIYANGFLTINGKKMSKSRGTFISARTYLNHLDAEYLRYYFASKLSSNIEDIDMNLNDLILKVNSDIIGKVVNIASRCSGFIHKISNGILSNNQSQVQIINDFISYENEIAKLYETREFSQATKRIMMLADKANQFIQENKPWELAKSNGNNNEIQQICSIGINLFKILITYLKPILPELARKSEEFLNISPLQWNGVHEILISHQINKFKPMMYRIEKEKIDLIVNETHNQHNNTNKVDSKKEEKSHLNVKLKEPEEISLSDFMKINLQVAKIISASEVDGADKLLKLILDVGSDTTKQVFAGIKANYEPQNLIGKSTVLVSNLAPRKMKFGISEGMVLAADDNSGPYILTPDSTVKPGTRVK